MTANSHFSLTVSGAAAVASLFLSLPQRIQRQVMTSFVRRSSADILRAVKPSVPVKTGALLKSLKSRAQSKRVRVRFNVDIGYSVRQIGRSGNVLHLIELGTKDRYTSGAKPATPGAVKRAGGAPAGKRAYRGKMKAKPFMRAASAPAMARIRSEVQTRLTREVQALLDKATRRNAERGI